MIAATYARFTEETNALDYLEKTIFFIKSAVSNPVDWKWIILSVHGALYSFLIYALKGPNPDNVSFKTKAWKAKLIDFMEALKRCQDPTQINVSGFSKALQLSKEQKQSVKRIHDEFRNQFVHYLPTIWSIELVGMPEIVARALDVVRMVSLEMGCYYVHHEPGDTQRIDCLIVEGQRILQTYTSSQES